jgi:glycosyltransferase involved in cell wall biosynthesis
VNHVLWACNFYRQAIRSKECPDIIFFSSTPLVASNLVLKLAKKMGSIAIMDVVDLWPEAFEIALPAGLRSVGKALLAPLVALETQNFQRANAITAVSETYRAHALERSTPKPSMVIPYGIDLESWPEKDCEAAPSHGKIRVCYAGTLGTHHDVETVIRAAKILESESHVEFILAGDGPHRAKIETLVKSLQVSNVTFTGWLPVAQLKKLLTTCDIGIIAVSKGSIISFPLKTYDYLAARVALVHSVSGELDKIVAERRLGVRYFGGDPDSLANAIRQLAKDRHMLREMGQRCHELIQAEFDRAIIHNRLIDFMSSLRMIYHHHKVAK